MNSIEQTFAEFGHSLGIERMAPGPNGGITLQLGQDQLLAFQTVSGGVLMLLEAPLPPGDTLAVKLRALSLCHWRHAWPLAIQAGISRSGSLVIALRLPERDFRLPGVEQALDLLIRLHQMAKT